jgi:hypothetical protein
VNRSKIKSSLVGLMATAALLVSVAPAAAADDAWVRVLHASGDTPAVDVYVNDGLAIEDLAFGAITDYIALPAASYDFKVCVANSDPAVPANCPINVADQALAAGSMYTIAATNELASIEAKILVDVPAPASDTTKVRIIHFSADTPAVDVLFEDGSPTGFEGLAYPNATDYVALPGGSYDLKVCVDGSDPLACPDAVNPPALDLANGTSYSVFAVGSLAGETLQLVLAADASVLPDSAMGRTSGGLPLTGLGILALVGAGLLVGRQLVTRPVVRD